MSGEERKNPDSNVETKLDPVELANNYGQMVDEGITMKPVSTIQNMDPETGDFIRPPITQQSLAPPKDVEAQREDNDEDLEKNDKEGKKKKRERQRKISKQSTKELVRQVLNRF